MKTIVEIIISDLFNFHYASLQFIHFFWNVADNYNVGTYIMKYIQLIYRYKTHK